MVCITRRLLEDRFIDEVDMILEKLTRYPTVFRLSPDRKTRLVQLPVFPYAVYYRVENSTVVLVCCYSTHRKPLYK